MKCPGIPPPPEAAPYRLWLELWGLLWGEWWRTSASARESTTTDAPIQKMRGLAEELCGLAERAQTLKDALVKGVDEDTQAFDSVIQGMRMPKDTAAEKKAREEAIQEGYKAATLVPLITVELCRDALEVCKAMVAMAPVDMMSDVGTGALVARAGLVGAAYNVRINLKSIKDQEWGEEIRGRLAGVVEEGEKLAREVEELMEATLGHTS